MQRLEVSGAVRPLHGSLGVKGSIWFRIYSAAPPSYNLVLKFVVVSYHGFIFEPVQCRQDGE